MSKSAFPALRERLDDIPELVEYFIVRNRDAMGKRVSGATSETIRTLMAAHWKGNVRQLDNAIERAVMMCEGEEIQPHDLPPDLLGGGSALPDTDDLRISSATLRTIAHYSRAASVSGQERGGSPLETGFVESLSQNRRTED